MAVGTEKQFFYIWFADDGNPKYMKRRLEEAVKISNEEVQDTIEEILHEVDNDGNPIYSANDYRELDKETVEYIGNYRKFESDTNIRDGYVYMIENNKNVNIFDVGIGEYINV